MPIRESSSLLIATLLIVSSASASSVSTSAPAGQVAGELFGSPQALSDTIRERVEWLSFQDVSEISGVRILSAELLAETYGFVDYEPLWLNRAQIDSLWQVAEIAHSEGLDTDDYPLQRLAELLPISGLPEDPIARTRVDLLATETLLRIGYQLRFGKVNPAEHFAEWNFDRPLSTGGERSQVIVDLIRADSLVTAVNQLTARGPLFDRLIELLAELRAIDAAGGWGRVSDGPTLRPGMKDSRVVELRLRLNAPADEMEAFDEPLKATVVAFQARHGLDADGIAGRQTLEALNVPVAMRIKQVRASLERARWVFEDFRTLDGLLVIVNIAAAEASLVNGDDVLWTGRAQVGTPYRQTPVFRGEMTYLEFNPNWTVPPTILRNDVLPKLRVEGTDYLNRKNMDLLDRDGRPVDLSVIDWPNLGKSGFPYIVRQRPGPWNALGLVKFMFPNSHFIFLHDTPSRELFSRSSRAFSSGCIRVERPFELAEILLNEPARWDRPTIDEVVASGKRTVAHLPESVPVYLLYWTAAIGEDGEPHFYTDIYGRDEVLFSAMDTDPVLDLGAGG